MSEEDKIIEHLVDAITKKIMDLPNNSEFTMANLLSDSEDKEYCYIDAPLQSTISASVRAKCKNIGITLCKNDDRLQNAFFINYKKRLINKITK